MRPRIALCLYGQYRTGDYCLPWIKQQFEFADVDVYAHLKSYNSFTNQVVPSNSEFQEGHIEEKLGALFGTSVKYVHVLHRHDNPFLARGVWHFASLFASIQASVYRALLYADKYDMIVAQRTDVLIGPTTRALASVWPSSVNERDLWVIDNNMGQIKGEARSGGLHDVFFMGSPGAMNLLVADTFRATCNVSNSDWMKFQFMGPNLFLAQSAHKANLQVHNLGTGFAIVRPNADLSVPVEQSFHYHQKFWVENHKGMNA
jgi:hypothetical protein